VPFADSEIFFGPIMEYADEHVAVIPDLFRIAEWLVYLLTSCKKM
jgi:hypothetical protein